MFLILTQNHGSTPLYMNLDLIEAVAPNVKDGTGSCIFTACCSEEGSAYRVDQDVEEIMTVIGRYTEIVGYKRVENDFDNVTKTGETL